jgi:hypothetical protein
MLQAIARGLGMTRPEACQNRAIWHRCRTPIFSRPTVSGGRTGGHGQTWRRRTAAGWEYRQDAETPEEFEARQY